MPKLKKTSSILEIAQARLSGLKAITPAADFGARADDWRL